MTIQLLTLIANKQASSAQKILLQNATYLQQIAVNAASRADRYHLHGHVIGEAGYND